MADINKAMSKNMLSPIVPVPYDRTNLFITRDEFIKKRKAIREAQKKAQEAYYESIKQNQGDAVDPDVLSLQHNIQGKKQLLVTLRDKITNLREEYKEDTSDKELKKDIAKFERQVGEVEQSIEELNTKLEGLTKK